MYVKDFEVIDVLEGIIYHGSTSIYIHLEILKMHDSSDMSTSQGSPHYHLQPTKPVPMRNTIPHLPLPDHRHHEDHLAVCHFSPVPSPF